ncbi:Uncharacterised protein [Legionella wadsworthii]|uniref:Uncharacterized protein n=1 Tax=Legionella wadsworthii TaxID=28088 RepID=A0A378LXA5_9GAMM|nr:hypothetical protein [Legionella wadsworthii]STY31043.1 Uncharacterised protein [Legionella wadsworthii]
MLKKIITGTFIFLFSCLAFCMPDAEKTYLANQCHELSLNIEKLTLDQINSCSSIIQEAAKLVEHGGQFILKEYWFNARTNLHRSYRLLKDANQLNCKKALDLSIAQKGIDVILDQIYGLE